MAKRIISVILSALMLVTCLPVTAFATEEFEETQEAIVLEAEEAVLAAEGVRFVNGAASTDGNGLTADTPYKAFSSAVNDLKDSGGTIVVVGATDFASTINTGDILVTSVYDDIDYRKDGATLAVNNHRLGYIDNPGKVTFDGLTIISSAWNNWHLHGHEFEITDDVTVKTADGTDVTNIQLLALISTGGNYAGDVMPDTHLNPLRVTIGNSNNAVLILGPCEDITIGDAYVTVNGNLATLSVSNNTWANYDHGQLSISGDVFVTVNGTLGEISARATETNDFSLEKFDGKISVIISSAGTLTKPIADHVKKRAQGWFTVRAAEGTTLTHGENGGDIVLVADGDYNLATFTNTTTSNTYSAKIENGTASITLTESGDYTVSLSNEVSYTLTLVNTLTDEESTVTAAQGSTTVLPTLADNSTYAFDGWTSTENGDTAEYAGGAVYTVNADDTLYSVWTAYEYPADVRFVNADTSVVSGNGRSPETPYKTIGQAATALATSGGTIVITGGKVPFGGLGNTGDLYITSVYDEVDYRSGTYLTVKQNDKMGIVDNPGKVTFDYLNIIGTSAATWSFEAHEVIFGKDCTMVLDTDLTSAPNFQLIPLTSAGDAKVDLWPDVVTTPLRMTIDNSGVASIIVGGREQVTVKEIDYIINGRLNSGIALSANSYNKWWGADWLDEDIHFGKLIVDGDVKVTVNGTLPKIYARYISLSESEIEYSLNKVTGNLGVIVNHGGTFTNGIESYIKEKVEGIWTVVNGAEGATLAYEGATADKLTLTAEGDYNLVTLTNTTTSKDYSFEIKDGRADITLTESGEYTTALSKAEIYSVEYVSSKGDAPASASGKLGTEVTLPTLANVIDYTFLGWSETEGATEADYEGGETYTITAAATLYAVWAETVYPENVRFVNAGAATNGSGRKPSSPYIKFSFAAADLATSGGTIVVMGKSSDLGLNATGDIVLTSVYGGIDYRKDGAMLVSNGGKIFFGLVSNPGTVTMENIVVQSSDYDSWQIFGYGLHVKDSVEILLPDGSKHTTVQYLLHATSDTQILPDEMPWETKLVIDNDNSGSVIFGPREDLVTGGYDITINGKMGSVAISNNTYESYYDDAWLETAKKFGQLTVDGDVKITLNGTMGNVRARRHQLTKDTYDYGLKSVNGNLGILINDGASFTGSIEDIVKARTTGKVFTVKSIEGVTLSYGDAGDRIVATIDEGYDYNYITLKGGVAVGAIAVDGVCELTVPTSGDYTIEATKKTVYGVSFDTAPFVELCPDAVYGEAGTSASVTIPMLDNQTGYKFKGWATTKGAAAPEITEATTLEYTFDKDTTYYAVWEEIATHDIYFLDEDGTTELGKTTGYEGSRIELPETKIFKYGKKLVGFVFEGTQDYLTDASIVPNSDVRLIAVWGDVPAGETRLYVSAEGSNGNDGLSPDKALNTIAKAVELLRDDGGYIVVTAGKITLTGDWNNKGDITLTSFDAMTGIDYRGKTSADGLRIENGAYIAYAYTGFGMTEMRGKITLENLILVNKENYQFLCFQGHPFEIGKGNSVYYQPDAETTLAASMLHTRALGEGGANKTNPEGTVVTVNGMVVGSQNMYTVGKAENTIPGITAVVDSDYVGNFNLGNDSGGGKTTIEGNILLTFNGSLASALRFTENFTNPVIGNTYAVYNNGSSADISAIKYAEGYGTYALKAGEGITLSHGENGSFVATGDKDGNIKVTDENGNILQFIETVDGGATIVLDNFGTYTAEYADTVLRQLTFDTGFDDLTVNGGWYEVDEEVNLAVDLYNYGYIFGGWTDGTDSYTDTFVMPDKAVTLSAIWEVAPMHTVKFDANGSNLSMPADIEEYVDEYVLLTKPEGTDTFIGWSEDKDAYTGFLDYTINGDKTLYAITAKGPAYIVESHYRGDPDDYTGPRNSFRRYVVDVYLENAVASEGAFKLDTDNGFLYYLGHIPQTGISASVTALQVSGDSGVPGLQYYTTPSVEFKWESEAPVDATNGRIKVARIMMYFSSWGMGYKDIIAKTSDEAISPFDGYTATADGETAYVSVNFYKGVKSDEVKVNGKVSFTTRPNGTAAKYDLARLYILDDAGDAIAYIPLESKDEATTTFDYETELAPGEYTIRVIKRGYLTRDIPVTVNAACTIPEIVLIAGDTVDEKGNADGKVTVDDFVRVLKGFSEEFPVEKYLYAIDINEDGTVNVADLAGIKNAMARKVGAVEVTTAVDTANYKIGDWSISVSDGVLEIRGGSDEAVESARELVENQYMVGTDYYGPISLKHERDYQIHKVTNNGVSLGEYKLVIAENDTVASDYAAYIKDYVAELTGYVLDIVYDTEAESDYEILVGGTARAENPITAVEKYEVYEKDGKFYVFYGDEQSAEMASLDLCEKILGKDSEGFDGKDTVEVVAGAKFEGEWSVLSRFGVMSDSHIGLRYNWKNYDWLYNTFANFEAIHAENPLDFIVSLGDNIDDGYANTYAADYAAYLEEIKQLDICDPVNPIDGRAEGMIPHYEICGNHDPIGEQFDTIGSIRFIKNKLWYTENEKGEKVAHIAYFTDYGGYPLYDYKYSGTYQSYYSYGKVNDRMVKFVEDSIIAANAEGAKHIILYSHWGISQQVGSPMLPETGLGKIADVCEKYGIKLYFNGHEHDIPYTLRRYKDIYDYDVSMTSQKHAVVEVTTLRAKVTIYYSADNTIYREDIVPLSGRGEAVQKLAE